MTEGLDKNHNNVKTDPTHDIGNEQALQFYPETSACTINRAAFWSGTMIYTSKLSQGRPHVT